jgi:hypothetical protein
MSEGGFAKAILAGCKHRIGKDDNRMIGEIVCHHEKEFVIVAVHMIAGENWWTISNGEDYEHILER